MSLTGIHISTASDAPFVALSASYKWDDNISLNPTFFQYQEGYSFFHHPIFTKSKDALYQNESFLCISPTSALSGFIDAQYYVDPAELVIFTTLQNISGNYITNVNDTLYANNSAAGQSSLFRISYDKAKDAWRISQNGLYATVELSPKRTFIINMEDEILNDSQNQQLFKIETSKIQNKLIIRSLVTIPQWSGVGWTNDVERFWSYSEFPGIGGIVPTDDYKVKLMGMVPDDDYLNDNSILWSVGLGDLNLLALGFNGVLYWVRYYNDIYTKLFNKTTDIKDKYEIISNLLIDWTYNTDAIVARYDTIAKTGGFKINMAQLKNVHTPDHSYKNPS
jgi:hypothetical protein